MKFLKAIFLLVLPMMMLMSAGTESSAAKKKYPGKKTYMFRVQLRDKSGTPYSLAQPSVYLSQKAIDRRARQHIAIDSTTYTNTNNIKSTTDTHYTTTHELNN